MQFPELNTQRLVLDCLSPKDAEALYLHFSNPKVVKYYDLEAFTSLEQANKLIQLFNGRFDEEQGIRWAIRLRDNAEFVGTCGFNSWNRRMRSATIGYDVVQQYWGKGYATEALSAMLTCGFADMLPCKGLHRIQGDIVPGNNASEAVLLKLGFKEEGLLRHSGYWKGCFHDLKCFSLLRHEYCAKHHSEQTAEFSVR